MSKLLPRIGGLAVLASTLLAIRHRLQSTGSDLRVLPAHETNDDPLEMILATTPDKIDFISNSVYTFTFAEGKNVDKLPIGSEYTMVYSNDGSRHPWIAIRFRVVPNPTGMSTSLQVVEERMLKPYEITHFERMIAQHQGQLQRENR